MAPIRIAVAGATGDLGSRVVRQLLSPRYSSQVSEVLFFTRNPSSAAAQELISLGVKPILAGFTVEGFRDIDVFLSVLGESTPLEERNRYVDAAAKAGVKVYIPTEYGIEHRKMPFEYKVWEIKNEHNAYARSQLPKVVSIYVGLFLDDTFKVGRELGLDTVSGVYTSVISPDVKVSFLSRDNIAASTARIAVLAASDPNSVPDYARISGSSASYREIAALVSKTRGQDIKVEVWDEEEVKDAVKRGEFWPALRYAIGFGLTDFSEDNANEIINPGESLWKWKTIGEYVEETKGLAPASD